MATGRIGTTPVLTTRWSKAPSAGTTSLSGLDDNSVSLVYSVGYEAVYQNGVLLSRGNDYTATNGTSITLTTATVAGDIIEVFANQTIPLTDTYSQTVSDGRFIKNTLTITTGDIIYASASNTPARLAIGSTDQVLKVSGGVPVWGAAGSSFVGCSLYKTANQTISHDTITQVTFDAEAYDTDGFHSTSTNTSRITIPTGKGGKYLFTFQTQWDLNGTGDRSIYYYKNGANGTAMVRYSIVSGSYYTIQNASIVLDLVAGDYIEMYVLQSSGGNLNIQYDTNTAQSSRIRFSASYLGA